MNNKTKYIQEVETQLDNWGNDIYKFRVIAEDAGWEDPDQQIKYYQIIESITDKKQEITDKLSALKDADSDWHVKVVEIDSLRNTIADNIKAAYSIVT